MRRPIVAGNWKMNKTARESVALIEELRPLLDEECAGCDVVLCQPLTSLSSAHAALAGSPIRLGAQNMHWQAEGAYTGDVSPAMILTSGCTYVILGHSERRQYAFETDEQVNSKLAAALAADLTPIVCVGESLAEREADRVEEVVIGQVRAGLEGVDTARAAGIVLAYEPVWAIGTGKTATAAQAEEVHALIRTFLVERFGGAVAEQMRIQYGGSVKPDNAVELFSQKNIDGGLIGGAALQAESFAAIVKATNA